MRDVLLAITFVLLTFLPFYMSSSPSSGSVSFVKLDPSKFEPIQGKESGSLHFILNGDPKTLNPVMAQESTSTAVIDYLFTGLTKTDIKTMRVLPDLAKSWEEKDSGRRYIFHLREGVRWSDGAELTADDVVFTYRDVYLNKDIPNSTADMLRGIIKTQTDAQNFVRKIDKYTVEFKLPRSFAPFLQVLSAPILPKHKLEKYIKEGSFPTAWNVDTDPKEIVGTGPYVIKRYVKGQFVEYSAHPYYYEKDYKGKRLPYIKSMIGIIVQDPDTALLRFSAEDVDYISVRPQDLLFMSRLRSITLYDLGPTPSTTFLVFNQNPKAKIPSYKLRWFQNRVFRQAISHAIDREGICYLVYNGLAEPLYTPITPANRPYYDEGYYPKYHYDLKLAKKLLESIGFKDKDKDGILEDLQGHKLEIVLLTNAGNKERETIGNIIKEDLEKIGVKVIFRPIDFNSLVSRLSSPPYEWEAVIIGLTGSIDPYFGRNVWHSSGTLHIWNPRQKSPQTAWEKQVDDLFDKGAQELDFTKRVSIYKKAFLIIAQEQPMIFIAVPKSMLAVYTNRFGNFFPTVWGWYRSETLFIK